MLTAPVSVLPSARNATVLVIDDQSIHRVILEEVLGGLGEQVMVEGIGSAGDAVAWATQRVADLVLVDYMMPEMNGIELVKRLRALPGYRHVPIVMVTMNHDRDVRYAALDAGVSDFLIKPVDARECRARCRNLLALRHHQLALEDRRRLEKIRAERGLREREAELRLIADHVPAVVAYWDRQLRCRYANRAFLDLFQVDLARARNAHISDIAGPVAWSLIEEQYRQALGGQTVTYERWLERERGEQRHITVRVVPHSDAAGAVLGCYTLSIDTTAEKRHQADLERQVAERTALLEAANDELASFSYTVSHDLRAPLRHIAGFVGMLGELGAVRGDEQAMHLVARAESAARRLGHMVDELLRYAQFGRQELRPEAVDLQALVALLREEFSAGLGARRVEWHVGALPAVHADATLLRLALQNLLDNALKYTGRRDTARIEVSAAIDTHSVTLCVRDNGAGFDMRYAGRLFGTFARMHGEEEFPGTGIGLAHVKRIVERHGGTVRAEAAPERGAAFFVRLPR